MPNTKLGFTLDNNVALTAGGGDDDYLFSLGKV
jgi:hypothetical protein